MAEWPEDALHTVAKKFIVSMNLPRRCDDESTLQTNDNDDAVDASRIELNELQLKLARMAIYLYESVKIASKR